MFDTSVLTGSIGVRDESGKLPMPPICHLSAAQLHLGGVYLISTSVSLSLWISKDIPSQTCLDLFGVASYESAPSGIVRTVEIWEPVS